MFHRRQVEKREVQLAIRVTAEERAAIDWCASELARRTGATFSASDVAREALADLYNRLKQEEQSTHGGERRARKKAQPGDHR